MDRRSFLTTVGLAPAVAQAKREVRWKPPLLANDYVTVFHSPDPAHVFPYSPGIALLGSGRLIATMDIGSDPSAGRKGFRLGGKIWEGKVFTSDDRGRTWQQRADTPMMHARPFAAGDSVYVLGHAGDLKVVRSRDNGKTWSRAAQLTEGQHWHQAPCNVHYHKGRVYLVMERVTDPSFKGWPVSVAAPVLMSARVEDDLTRRESWTFSSELSFHDAVAEAGAPNLIGDPFFRYGNLVPDRAKDRRSMAPIGWLETNVVQFTDPNHDWYDPAGRTFHLWLRAHTGSTNLACIVKAVESEDRSSITVSLEKAPSGKTMLYVPCPGGQMKFHILYDDVTRLFWLVSSQATDSMTRPDRLPDDRYNLPNNERHRLALHFSRNCVDWCFAGLVAKGATPRQARNYASMVIDGEDLHVLSRSGDASAASAHNGDMITFHTVHRFRDLVY